VDDVRAFFRLHYVPANASLVIAGDFDPAVARRLVDRYFAWMPARAAPPRAQPKPVVLAADQRRDVPDNVQLPRIEIAWHAPAEFAPGDAELDLAARILGGGKSSRLYRALVYDKRVAQNASAGQSSAQLGSRFRVTVTAKPGHTLDEIERAIGDEVARFAATPPTDEEVGRARNKLLADLYEEMDTLAGRAELLNHYEHMLGDPGGLARDVERYRAVTPAAVKAVFAQVVAGKRVVVRTIVGGKPAPVPVVTGKLPAIARPDAGSKDVK
jgi:zinc protease